MAKRVRKRTTLEMIKWMNQEWYEDLEDHCMDDDDFHCRMEGIGDNAARDILATRYWDGKRRCAECGTLTDRWFRGKLCRGCWFRLH